jgi:glycosyltransferase involved in cell wall biosynthesis
MKFKALADIEIQIHQCCGTQSKLHEGKVIFNDFPRLIFITGWICSETSATIKAHALLGGRKIALNLARVQEHDNLQYPFVYSFFIKEEHGAFLELCRDITFEVEKDKGNIGHSTVPFVYSFLSTSSSAETLAAKNRKLIRELFHAYKETEAFKNSLSWRITGPFRFVLGSFLRISQIWSLLGDSFRQAGLKTTLQRCFAYLSGNRKLHELPVLDAHYSEYLKKLALEELDTDEARMEIAQWPYQPKISIVLPVYNTPEKWLKLCIQSVLKQHYNQWELCIYDDASTQAHVAQILNDFAKKDSRIRVSFGKRNLHISEASNHAINLSTGEFIALLDHDDELHPAALYEVVKLLQKHPQADVVYSDEDKISTEQVRSAPYFKSDFNFDLLLGNNYICHFTVIRKAIGEKVGWFRKGFEGAQDHDLLLRLSEVTKNIFHIPKVLYHWRLIPGSTASGHSEKDYAELAGKRCLEDYVKRNSIHAEVISGPWKGAYYLKRKLQEQPQVSIIVPFKDGASYLRNISNGILQATKYSAIELLLVDNNSEKEETAILLEELKQDSRVKVLKYEKAFNFSAINNFAVAQSTSDYVLLLNNDMQIIHEDWLERMMSEIVREDVGAVGGSLWYEDDTLQHYGVILGIGGMAGHAFKGFPAKECRHYSQGLVRNVSAVTGACLLTKKHLYTQVGGLDEEHFKIALNDIDFCLKIREMGHLIVFTPYACLYHFESKSRGYEDTPEKKARFAAETKAFQEKWGDIIFNDPYYNVNLTLQAEDFSLRMQ